VTASGAPAASGSSRAPFSRLERKHVDAAAREGAPPSLLARLAEAEPAIVAHATRAGYDRGRDVADALLRACTIAWHAFQHRFGPDFPRILEDDLRVARKDVATAPEKQPHLVAAVDSALGAHAADRAVRDEVLTVVVALDAAAMTMPRPPWPWLPEPVQKGMIWLRGLTRPSRDDAVLIPRRLPLRIWLFAIFIFLGVYLFTFTVVHVEADTRRCIGHLSGDPFHNMIPLDLWWWTISITGYTIVTLTMVGLMFIQAFLGDHRPILRFGIGLSVMGAVRAVCILLVPLCRHGTPAGGSRFGVTPMTDVFGWFELPWRLFASNDLLYSGHVAELILFLYVTRSWPRPARWFLWAFQFAQIYALLATRGHYTVDIILAIPCAYYADRMAVKFLSYVSRHREELAARRYGVVLTRR
jgi:hypothetical protein